MKYLKYWEVKKTLKIFAVEILTVEKNFLQVNLAEKPKKNLKTYMTPTDE